LWRVFQARASSISDRSLVWIIAAVVLLTAFIDWWGGGEAAAAVTVLGAIGCALAARALAPLDGQRGIVAATVAVLALRAAGVAILHVALSANGSGGAMFSDDAGYMQLADALLRRWQGLPVSNDLQGLLNDTSVSNWYVTMAAVVYWITGSNALALKLVNTILSVLTALVTYRSMLALRLPGARIALALLLMFPSLVLWSALALKDTFVLFLMSVAVWAASEAISSKRYYLWYIVVGLALIPLENIRRFAFLILVIALPFAMLAALPRDHRIAKIGLSGLLTIALLFSTSAWSVLSPEVFGGLAFVRSAMAQNARTAFVEPPPIAHAQPGDRFTVVVPGVTAQPNQTPRLVCVVPGTELVVQASPDPTTARPSPNSAGPQAFVRQGDVVVVVSSLPTADCAVSAASPAPASQAPPPELRVSADLRNIVAGPTPVPPTNEVFVIGRDVLADAEHLPIGILYLALAPFPWSARTPTEIATIPDVLLWMGSEFLALVGLVYLLRRRDLGYAYGVLSFAGLALVLSLAEGNVGTLLRHRAMLIPEVAVLAAVGVSALRQQGQPQP
jgi:hypothetical protein